MVQVLKTGLALVGGVVCVWMELLHCSSRACQGATSITDDVLYLSACPTFLAVAYIRWRVCECRGNAVVLVTIPFAVKVFSASFLPVCMFVVATIPLMSSEQESEDNVSMTSDASIMIVNGTSMICFEIAKVLALIVIPLIIGIALYVRIVRIVIQSTEVSEKHQLDSEDDDDEYVYSNCVTNFYKRMRETSLKEQMRLADDDDDEDVEEDLFKYTVQPAFSSIDDSLVVGDDNLSNNACMSSSPERNTNSSLLVKSPTPPPSPPKQLPKKARNTKKRKQLQRAMECLSSDIRTAQSELVAANTSADYDVLVLEDEDSEQVTMRVAIQGDIERFTYKMDDPFENMMNMIKGTKACDRVMLVFNDCTISRHDTPRVVGYSVGDIITCHLLNGEESFMEDSHTDTSSDCVEIVVQSNFSRQKEVILAKIKCPMSAVLSEYASRIKTPAEDLVLNFDGDVVDVTLTPEDLEVEAGDIFDVKRNNVVIIR